jgi:hypothetical protein
MWLLRRIRAFTPVFRRALAGILTAALAAPGPVRSEAVAECLPSADAVRAAAPAAWPSYTLHGGERCWYPTTKGLRHVHQHESEVMQDDGRRRQRFTTPGREHDTRPRPASLVLSSRGPAGAVIRIVTDWHGARITVMPDDDPLLFHWMFGDRLEAGWQPLFEARERLNGAHADAVSERAFTPIFALRQVPGHFVSRTRGG